MLATTDVMVGTHMRYWMGLTGGSVFLFRLARQVAVLGILGILCV